MKQSKAMLAWNVIYPVFMYYAITGTVLIILNFLLPARADLKLPRQLITTLAVLPYLISCRRKDPAVQKGRARAMDLALAVLIGACFAVAFNNLLGMVRIADYSPSYAQVEKTFYTGRLALEIVSLCIVIPIAEETLYRGIVYERSAQWLGDGKAALLSAVIFGLAHMNLAQFVYATVFGLLLSFLARENGNIFGAIAAHMAANLTSTLRAETGFFSFPGQSFVLCLIVTVLLFAVSASGLLAVRRRGLRRREGR